MTERSKPHKDHTVICYLLCSRDPSHDFWVRYLKMSSPPFRKYSHLLIPGKDGKRSPIPCNTYRHSTSYNYFTVTHLHHPSCNTAHSLSLSLSNNLYKILHVYKQWETALPTFAVNKSHSYKHGTYPSNNSHSILSWYNHKSFVEGDPQHLGKNKKE